MSERERDVSGSEESQALPRLRLLTQGEARRFLVGTPTGPQAARAAEGWERRFVAEGARAEEMIEFYRELGFEVVADPVLAEDLPSGCESCRLLLSSTFRVIYTRGPARVSTSICEGSGR